MASYFAPHALLPSGWARDVRIRANEEGRILSVDAGEHSQASEFLGEIVVPGIPNVHSHAFQRAMAGLAEYDVEGGDSFWRWREVMYGFLQKLDPDDVNAIAAKLYLDMTKAGYTSVGEFHYLHHDRDGSPYENPAEMSLQIVEAATRTGIRLTHFPVVYTSGGFGGMALEDGQRRFRMDARGAIDILQRLDAAYPEAHRLQLGLALHSLRAVPPEEMTAGLAGAEALGVASGTAKLPIHIHVAEQEREVEACVAWSGARPVAWLLENAPVGPHWCLIHATHMDDAEIAGVVSRGAVAGLCPTTEANLGDGVFRLGPFLESGGRFGVGSDSHVSVDPVEELRWLEYGQRLTTRRRNIAAAGADVSTGRALVEGAVAGGAAALGHGAAGLQPGAFLDLLSLDPEHPDFVGRSHDRQLDAWIFSGRRSPIRHVMVGGEWVVRDGVHPREAEVEAVYRAAVRRLV